MRLAKQIAATVFEITDEIAREKKLIQARISVTNQNKYGLLLHREKFGVVSKTLIVPPIDRTGGSEEERLS